MRKLFALLFVAGTIAFASCQGGEKSEHAEGTDTAATAPVETVTPADTAATTADTTAGASTMDTTKAAH